MTDEKMRKIIEEEIKKSPMMKRVCEDIEKSDKEFKALETNVEKLLFLLKLINSITFVVAKMALNANPVADLFDRLERKEE